MKSVKLTDERDGAPVWVNLDLVAVMSRGRAWTWLQAIGVTSDKDEEAPLLVVETPEEILALAEVGR